MNPVWLSHYPAGVPAEVDVRRYASLVDLFAQSCQKFSDWPAFTSMGATLSYAETDLLARDFAALEAARRDCLSRCAKSRRWRDGADFQHGGAARRRRLVGYRRHCHRRRTRVSHFCRPQEGHDRRFGLQGLARRRTCCSLCRASRKPAWPACPTRRAARLSGPGWWKRSRADGATGHRRLPCPARPLQDAAQGDFPRRAAQVADRQDTAPQAEGGRRLISMRRQSPFLLVMLAPPIDLLKLIGATPRATILVRLGEPDAAL